ncbi:MAG TPA: ABC transporter ATP-binding protein [Bacteroides sp.]|nr:ABC transporter ATP-binding protein [Bacteroides sp.]
MDPSADNRIVSLEHMAIGYAPEKVLLSEINLSLLPGEMVALVGRNGTGKSTLLRSILGFLPVLGGECLLFGAPADSFDLRRRARVVSYVSSRVPAMPSMSVRELVSLGRMPHTGWAGRQGARDREAVWKAMGELGMEDFADRKVDQLSDGERHRAMIARAMAQETVLMVLDEPTAFLDIPNKYELIRTLGRFRDNGRSVIFSTHDLETAWLWADKFWVIHGSKIVEGAPEDLGIMHVFEHLFADSDITFDPSERRFMPHFVPRGTICLEGEEPLVMYWTRTALERLGYRIDKHSGRATIRVTGRQGEYGWQWITDREEKFFPDIYSLARFLIQAE